LTIFKTFTGALETHLDLFLPNIDLAIIRNSMW